MELIETGTDIMSYVRLDKYLADGGYGTRSRVKEMLKKNVVRVNGMPVVKGDYRIDTDRDKVLVNNNEVVYNRFEYYMLNKPQGVVSATKDSRDKTVVDLIRENKRRDLFPVGRLDKDTEGLLIITNDGKLANNLLAPGKHVAKSYYVTVLGEICAGHIKALEEGIDIGDDLITAPAGFEDLTISCTDGKIQSSGVITITEGRYHQIKRMFMSLGLPVIYLKRMSMGALKLDDTLLCGDYRKLTPEEISLLKSGK